ncbi:MAG: transposase [Hydrogenophilales bacterium CG17_big_fil_post_rev_8_21_14_2_50_63_12]|nr:DDE-type integrase/transposase/recombinase [Rhodobacterales bacterium]PIV89031.1 MAG: transposase [Hydrogenophilales bacterium CG17_big_fil_post_rev_8_21_14_2_50_63_12]
MDLETVPKAVWQKAEERAVLLRPLAALDEAPAHLVRVAAIDLQISERWAYRLIRRLREENGKVTALLSRDGRGAPRKPRIAGDREAIIRQVIEDLYLKRQKVRPSEVVRTVQIECRKAGISAPSEATVRRRINRIDKGIASRRRADDPSTKPILGAIPIPKYPLDVVQIDHTPVDVILVDPFERLPIGRPYLTVAIDVMSRTIAGFHLGLDPPSATSVGLCLTHVAEDKKPWMTARGITDVEWPIAGKPKKVGVDNAGEFHSQAFERGCTQHGIEIDWRPPGQPQFGGIVERVIGTLMRRIHKLPGTTFSNTAQRGTYDSEGRACLTLEELERWLTVAICKDYHRSGHRGLDGTAPVARLEEGLVGLSRSGDSIAIPRDMRSYLIDFLPVLRRTLQRDGFTVDHIRYFSNALKPWIVSRDVQTEGSLILRRDPRDISRVYVLDPFDGSWLEVPYRTLSRPSMTLWEHRAARRRAQERNAATVDEDAIFAAFEEMQQIEREAARLSKSARRRQSRPELDRQTPSAAKSQGADPAELSQDDTEGPPRPFTDIEEW